MIDLSDRLKECAPLCPSIRSKTKTNQDSLALLPALCVSYICVSKLDEILRALSLVDSCVWMRVCERLRFSHIFEKYFIEAIHVDYSVSTFPHFPHAYTGLCKHEKVNIILSSVDRFHL